MHAFKLNNIDHVALRVTDIEISIDWYQKVLGLKMYKKEEWGEIPVFMLSDKFGVALFPASKESDTLVDFKGAFIDHFAFNLDDINYAKACEFLKLNKINFNEQDHFYFKSIYMRDPDQHIVELTCLTVEENEFY